MQSVQTVPCPHCGEPVRPTATFCLACDNPIVDTDRGLSVAEAVPASIGRPLIGLAVGLVCLALLGGATYGGLRIYHHARVSTADAAANDVHNGLTLIVAAERGRGGACRALTPLLAAKAPITLAECHAIVGDDQGAKVTKIRVGTPHFAKGGKGTAQVHATVTDAAGRHTIDKVVDLVEVRRHWRMAWNGAPLVSPQAA